METLAAVTHLAAGGQQGIGEGTDLLLGLTQQVQGQALRRARTDARQTLELVDQPGEGSGEAAQRTVEAGRTLGSPRR
jgi:hypothetical protein